MQIIPISEIQRKPGTLKNIQGWAYISSNNEQLGCFIGGKVFRYMEEHGILEDLEDAMLASGDPSIIAAEREVTEAIDKKDFSGFSSFADP